MSSNRGVNAHLTSVFIPLIVAGIFFASNGSTHIAFIDALFLCVSAITVTGLVTIDLSSATPWQQVILFILMCLGSPVTISWIMVLVRRYFFAQKFKRVLDSDLSSVRPPLIAVSDAQGTQRVKKFSKFLPWSTKTKLKESWQLESRQVRSWDGGQSPGTRKGKLRPEMIRRVPEVAPQRVNPLGLIGNPCKDPDLTSMYRPNSAPVLRFAGCGIHCISITLTCKSDPCQEAPHKRGCIRMGQDVHTRMDLHIEFIPH